MKLVTRYEISAIKSCWEKCDEKCTYMFNVYRNQLSRQTGSRNLMVQKCYPQYGIPIWCLWPNIRFLPSIVAEKNATKNEHICSMCRKINSRQTGSRNLMGPKTLPTIWGAYMKLVTKYQISAINSCWEKCDEKWAYMFSVYKNQLSRQTGSRNLTGPKTLPAIWYTYMTLVTEYQISAINSYWEKCDKIYLGRTEGRTDGRTDLKQYTPSPFGEREHKNILGREGITIGIHTGDSGPFTLSPAGVSWTWRRTVS